MSPKSEISIIESELKTVKEIFLATLKLIPKFDITDTKVLPFGLKEHTRSVSWIAEQVIAQQAKLNAKKLDISDVELDFSPTGVIDCIIIKDKFRYAVNIKIFQLPFANKKNDISSLTKLYDFYKQNSYNRIIYVCFGFKFEKLSVKFSTENEDLIVFSPQLAEEFYFNLGNNKIQFKYKHTPVARTRDEFLQILKPENDALIQQQNERKEKRKNAK